MTLSTNIQVRFFELLPRAARFDCPPYKIPLGSSASSSQYPRNQRRLILSYLIVADVMQSRKVHKGGERHSDTHPVHRRQRLHSDPCCVEEQSTKTSLDR